MQPAARAGATLHAIWLIGQFHGVISPQTPAGSRITRDEPMSSSNSKRLRTLNVDRKCPRPAGAWAAIASPIGAPISALMAFATSGMRFL